MPYNLEVIQDSIDKLSQPEIDIARMEVRKKIETLSTTIDAISYLEGLLDGMIYSAFICPENCGGLAGAAMAVAIVEELDSRDPEVAEVKALHNGSLS